MTLWVLRSANGTGRGRNHRRGRVDAPQLNKRRRDGFALKQQSARFGLSGRDFLFGLDPDTVQVPLRFERVLLGDLLGLDGVGKTLRELEVGDVGFGQIGEAQCQPPLFAGRLTRILSR